MEKSKLKRATYHLWTVTASKFIVNLGYQVFVFAISLYILRMTGSAMSFAINIICGILPRTIFSPLAGHFVDKYSKKKILITANIIDWLAVIGLLVVSFLHGLALPAIYITTAIFSMCGAFSSLAFTASLTQLIDGERIQRAMSLNQMSVSIAAIAGPAIGGILYGIVSIETFLIIYIVASLIDILLISTLDFNLFAKKIDETQEQKAESFWESTKAGFAYLRLQRILIVLISSALVINFFTGGTEVGYSYILVEVLKMDSHRYGITESAFAVGMLVFSLYLAVRKEVKYPLILAKWGIVGLGGIFIAMCLPLIITFSSNFVFVYYFVLNFLLGSAVILINTPISVMMQKTIAEEYKGRIFAIMETLATALIPLGTLVYGGLYDWLPAQWVMGTSGLVLIVYILFTINKNVIKEIYHNAEQSQKPVEVRS